MTTLVDRYVDEAVSRVGTGIRDEIRREIHGMVDELVETRVAQGEPSGAATERVLNELGSPRRLARAYAGERRYLIGPRYYDEYVGLLAAIASRVLPLAVIAIFAANLLEGDGVIGSLVGGALAGTIWTTITVGVQVAFWVTVAFVIMERSRRGDAAEPAVDGERWTVADLPPVRPKRQISAADALTGLGFTVFIGLIFVLVYRNGINMYLGDERSAELDGTVPLFNPDIPATVAWLVLGLLAADALLDVVKYAVGSWTRFVAFGQVALNVVWTLVALTIVGAWNLVNPGIRGAMSADAADLFLDPWFEQSVLAATLVISAIAIWEAVRGFLAWRPQPDPWSV